MSSQEEQLISFFAYSFFVYPVTNWLVQQPQQQAVVAVKQPKQPQGSGVDGENSENSTNAAADDATTTPTTSVATAAAAPETAAIDAEKHKADVRWRKWRGVILAVIFLITVSALHMAYENMESGPNAYSMLNMSRGSSTSLIKRTYRNLSRALHPDKNKSPTAAEDFQRVTHAYNVIIDTDLRRVYNILGEQGVKASAQTVIDHKYIMVQMVVYYASSLIFAFLMTFSDPSGDAFALALFGLTFMLFVETCLVLEEFELPVWFLPYTTSHDIVATMHRVFPAFMNGGRSIIGVFSENEKENALAGLAQIQQSASYVGSKVSAMLMQVSSSAATGGNSSSRSGSGGGGGGGTALDDIPFRGGQQQLSDEEKARREREEHDVREDGLMAMRMRTVVRQQRQQQQQQYDSSLSMDGATAADPVQEITRTGEVLADAALSAAASTRQYNTQQQQGGGSSEGGKGGTSFVSMLDAVQAWLGDYLWVGHLLAYCLVRYLARGLMPKQ
jgi:hypothetical protein